MPQPTSPPSYLAANQIDSSAAITSSSEDSDWPHENLFEQGDNHYSKPFRWTESSGVVWLEIDFASAVQPTMVFIGNHNFPSGTTFDLKASATATATTSRAVPAWRKRDIYALVSASAFRYWRLEASATHASALEMGTLYLGVRTDLSRSFRFGRITTDQHNRIHQESVRGARWVWDNYDRRRLDYTFRHTDTTIDELETMDQAVSGPTSAFVFVPDRADSGVYFVRKMDDFVRTNQFRVVDQVPISLEEEAPGVNVG